jgi:hypothetical protein
MSAVGKLIYEVFGLGASESIITSKDLMYEAEVELETDRTFSEEDIGSVNKKFADYGIDIRWLTEGN